MIARKAEIINFKVSEHLRNAIEKTAEKKGLTPSAFIREVLKKYIKYKEPEVL
jgi:predicted DNA binding CopG/RHH family protein